MLHPRRRRMSWFREAVDGHVSDGPDHGRVIAVDVLSWITDVCNDSDSHEKEASEVCGPEKESIH